MKISYATSDITPTTGMALAGYGKRTQSSTSTYSQLEVNGILLSAEPRRVAILSVDALYVGEAVISRIRTELKELGTADQLEILFCASHTHFAPQLDPAKPILGSVDLAYLDFFVHRTTLLLRKLLSARPEQTTLYLGTAPCHAAVNRRRYGWRPHSRPPFWRKELMILPNEHGAGDPRVTCIMLKGENQRPQAVIWSFACHPVGGHDTLAVSSDFPGYVRDRIRERADDPQLPVLFLQGFSGTLRPRATSLKGTSIRTKINHLINRPVFGRFTESQYVEWCDSIWHSVDVGIKGAEPSHDTPCRFTSAALPLQDIIPGADPRSVVTFFNVTLSRSTSFLCATAEVAAEWLPMLRDELGRTHFVCVGCVNVVFEYLPTSQMVSEKGYEAGGFFPAFSLRGRFGPDLDRLVLDAISELMH